MRSSAVRRRTGRSREGAVPLYDYQCEAGHRVEKREPFGSPAHQPCDKCGRPAHRLLNAPPILFKGSGWYSTDSSRTFRAGVNEEHARADGDDSSESSDDAPATKPAEKKTTRAKASDSAAKPAARSTRTAKPAAGDS
jgi:putative FmdB family regulatory protein